MNEYEAKKEARIERYLARAEKAKREANARFNSHNIKTLRDMAGEPVKIGHHSEKRHRRLIERADNDMRKGCEAMDAAKHYAEKAAAAESNTAISSDDPEAVAKLREELAGMEATHAEMKSANAKLRKAKVTLDNPARLDELDLPAWIVKELVLLARICPYEWRPYAKLPSYKLTNSNANIRRVKARLAELVKRAEKVEAIEAGELEAAPDKVIGKVTIREDIEDNRILVIFPGKPPKEVCKLMRSRGFKWSPTRTAWVRHLANGRWAAEHVATEIAKIWSC